MSSQDTEQRNFPLSHLPAKEWAFAEKLDPEFVRLFFQVRAHVHGEGSAIPRKYKELIHICFLCQRGAPDLTLLGHLRRAKSEGVTNAELMEALELTMIAAGVPAFFHGVIALMKLESEDAK